MAAIDRARFGDSLCRIGNRSTSHVSFFNLLLPVKNSLQTKCPVK